MIYTLTLNPSIDYVMTVDSLALGEVNRSRHEEIYFGGKGINVSLMLNRLGVRSKALGFCAGFTGKAIDDGVRAEGVETDFVYLTDGASRINVKIRSGKANADKKTESEINGIGPRVSEQAIYELFSKLEQLQDGDILVLSGSTPKTEDPSYNIYDEICKRLLHKKLRLVVDTAGEPLLKLLKYRPFLIKPNRAELGQLFGEFPETDEQITEYAERLIETGAKNVLVSLAGDGSVLLDENRNVIKMPACIGKTVNSVGAGDSMVAGFIAGYLQTGDYIFAQRLGSACGSATAFSSGLGDRALIDKLLESIK